MNFGWKLSTVGTLFGTRIGELPVRNAVDRSMIWWLLVDVFIETLEICKSFNAMIFCIDRSCGVPILFFRSSTFDALFSFGIMNAGLVAGFLIENLGILNFGLSACTEVLSIGRFVKWKLANSASLLKLFGVNGCSNWSLSMALGEQHKSYLMKDDPNMKKKNLREKKTVL